MNKNSEKYFWKIIKPIRFKNLIWFKVNSVLNPTDFKNLSSLLNAKKLTNYFFKNLKTSVLLSKSAHLIKYKPFEKELISILGCGLLLAKTT